MPALSEIDEKGNKTQDNRDLTEDLNQQEEDGEH